MEESTKKTFAGWVVGLITPERLFWLFSILLGLTLTTGYNLNRASFAIKANTTTNMEQDASMAIMDGTLRRYAIDLNTLTVNQQNIEKGQNEIKQMIRDIQ